jgi:hypothetical protein
MTAITARINSTTSDLNFLRGLLMGVIAAGILAAAIVAAIVFAPTSKPANAPSVQRPAPVQVDQNHPIIRPGGVKVY